MNKFNLSNFVKIYKLCRDLSSVTVDVLEGSDGVELHVNLELFGKKGDFCFVLRETQVTITMWTTRWEHLKTMTMINVINLLTIMSRIKNAKK